MFMAQFRSLATTTAAVAEDGVSIAGDGFRGTRVNTRAWADNQEVQAKLDAVHETERMIADRARNDAKFYAQLKLEKDADPEFAEQFENSRAEYRKVLGLDA